MKLNEIKKLSESEKKPGTYAAVKFDDATKDALIKFQKINKIPNAVLSKELHCTLLYSRKHLPNYEAMGKIDPPYVGTPEKLEIWRTNSGDNKEPSNCLILKFDCKPLVDRHKFLMKEHDATFDFEKYIPHVTLSYDIGELKLTDFEDITKCCEEIVIVEEYSSPLDDNWAEKNK